MRTPMKLIHRSSLFLFCTRSILRNQRNGGNVSRLVSSRAVTPPSVDGRENEDPLECNNALNGEGENVLWLSGNSAKGPYRLAYRHVVPRAASASYSANECDHEIEHEPNRCDIVGGGTKDSSSIGIGSDNDNDNNNNKTIPSTQQSRVAILFCNGFRSALSGGTKVLALEAHCQQRGWEFCAFDYRGHGLSSGDFADFVLSDWIEDACIVLDRVVLTGRNSSSSSSNNNNNKKRVILVGSSMGAWISVHLALRYNSEHPKNVDYFRNRREDKDYHSGSDDPVIGGVLGIASAPDFLRDFESASTPEQCAAWRKDGVARFTSRYDPDPVPITSALIEDAEARWELLPRSDRTDAGAPAIAVRCPVRLLHGKCDEDVPWTKSAELANLLRKNPLERGAIGTTPGETNHNEVGLALIEDGDHRLSRPQDIRLLVDTLDAMVA